MKTTAYRFCLLFLSLIYYYCNVYAQTTGYSGTGANIDVTYHRAEWTINPEATNKSISGVVTTYFITKAASVSKITFDLNGVHTVSATYHGTAISVTRPSTNVIELTLPATLAINTLDSVSITYSGTPPSFGTYGEGYERTGTVAGGDRAIWTLAESYGDEDWWPCKADMQDRVESMDIIITTPSAYMAATNGKLVSNVVSGANRIMRYEHRYAIPTYLVAVAVAKYNVFNRGTVTIGGTAVPITYYLYANRGTNPTTELAALDFCKDELIAFSAKYGDYPFKNEKYGMYEFGWGGGMEHQTFSAMGSSTLTSWSIIAHELAHQWWGDKVTFSTWNHLWLAEGFAKYSEVLAAELVAGLGQDPVAHRASIKTTALATSTAPVYLSSIAHSGTIWTDPNEKAIYQRGAMVVSMLRKLAGDTKFFQACQNYLNDPLLAYKSATTTDLKNHFEAVLGYDLDGFFDDYIYGVGNPAYDVRWGKNGNRVNVQLTTQRRSAGTGVSYFRTPVVLKFSNATKDTTVVIYDENTKVSYAGKGAISNRSGRTLGYLLSFSPTSVTIDPDSETLVRGQDGTAAQSSVTPDATLNNLSLILLDISIASFEGSAKGTHNLLTLKLAATSEPITAHIERSRDGIHFSTLGPMEVQTVVTSNLQLCYKDRSDVAGTWYYRAKATDAKGEVTCSKIVVITNSTSEVEIKVIPNPAQDFIQVRLPAAVSSLIIRDTNGASVYTALLQPGEQIKRIDIRHLATGFYTIEFLGNNVRHSTSFACQR